MSPCRPDPEQWWITAYHEAGHAGLYIRLGMPFTSACIYERDGEVLGAVHTPAGRYSYVGKAIASLAGPVAEAWYRDIPVHDLLPAGSRTDVRMAKDALARGGLADFEMVLPAALQRAHGLVLAEWPRIEVIAAALVQHRQLAYDEVLRLIRAR